ncbi:MAG TPA: hypothetical protein ENH80_09690, partial [Phycisphaerae bacterium]|nr:hypothetical protein [Phycisphaerae bacterium]
MKQLTTCALVLVIAMASQAEATNVPYMEVQYDQLPDGNWEYIYDVYGGGSSWFVNVGLSGFDASAIINQAPAQSYGGHTGTLLQKWDYIAANNPATYERYVYGSYSTDGATWTLLSDSDTPVGPKDWTIDNTWHAPSEYVGAPYVIWVVPSMLYPGQIAGDGQSLIFKARQVGGAALDGLIFTFRILHPNSPAPINWSSYSYLSSTTTGTILGPAEIVSVSLDIKPGSDANSVNLKSMGLLPVVVYGSEELDVTEISLDTLLLNGVGPRLMPDGSWHVSFEDVDGDLLLDLVIHFEMQALGIEPGMTDLTLTGLLMDGTGLQGADAIRIVPDFNGDLMVNATDLAIMKHSYGAAGVGFELGDANADG